jgi:WD40 repeat protein
MYVYMIRLELLRRRITSHLSKAASKCDQIMCSQIVTCFHFRVKVEPLFVIDTRHHGKGPIIFGWHPEGSYVASTGNSRVVHIFDRVGEMIDQIVPPHPSMCTALEWNNDGSVLAIMQQSSATVVLWELHTRKTVFLDTHMKDLTFMQWSKVSTQVHRWNMAIPVFTSFSAAGHRYGQGGTYHLRSEDWAKDHCHGQAQEADCMRWVCTHRLCRHLYQHLYQHLCHHFVPPFVLCRGLELR